MKQFSLERAPFACASGARSGRKALRRASLLVGAGLFLDAAPAWAVNECGPPPPGGGTVTCEGQEYPNGIQYLATGNLQVLAKAGFLTRRSSTIEASGSVTVDTATDFRDIRFVSESPGLIHNDALRIIAGGPVFVRANRFLNLVAGGSGGNFVFAGSADILVGSVDTWNLDSPGILLEERFPVAPGPPSTVRLQLGFVATRGDDSPAVAVLGGGGDIRIDASLVFTEGPFSPGISAYSTAPGSRTFIASNILRTRGDRSHGVRAEANIVIFGLGTVSTNGANSPAVVASGNSGVAITAGTVTTEGIDSTGITAVANSGDIEIVSGSVTTGGPGSEGILALSTGGNVTITSGSVVTRGANVSGPAAIGIDARSQDGIVTVTSGSVATGPASGGHGIFARSQNADVRVQSDSVTTQAPFANGIFVTSATRSATITSGSIATQNQSASGIVVLARQGGISVTSGSITTTGMDSFGILAIAGPGTLSIVSNGNIVTTGPISPGLSAEGLGNVIVSANNVSASGANSDAIAVKGATSTVTVRGLVQASQGAAVRAQGGLRQGFGPGGPTTVNILAGGTVRGQVSFTDGADRIDNSGTFDAIGTSQFLAGTDLFDNNAGATARSVNGTATFAGLETFNNRGTVEMRDGATDDSLILSGAYVGIGGARLGLDVDFTAGTADRLVTGAATGSTLIEVQGSGGGFTSGILVVDAGAGTSPTAFSLAGGMDTAYLRRDLRFDPANNDFLLVQLPGTAVFETSRFGAMATQLWYESADAIAAQLDTVRDGRRGRGLALWLQGWTGEREHGGAQTLAGAGTFDVSFEQDFQGLQGGLDFQAGSAVFGITGGAGRSDAVFVSGNQVDMKVKNVGLYAQGRAGPFFFNALAKRDWAEIEVAPGPGLDAEFDADLFGVQANAGLRIGSGAIYAEPTVGLSWVQADLDSFESGPATVEPGSVDSLRARAGLRVGARLPLGGGDLLPFVAANVYEELGGRNESDFTLGETLRLFDEPAGTRGQAAAGVSFASAGFEAFVRGEMDFSGGADAKAVRAGARLRF